MNPNKQTRVDAHQHFWHYNTRDQAWITDDMSRIRLDFLPADLAPQLKQSSIDYSVLVQARQDLDEAPWLLELAQQNDFIAAVVGWVDLCSDAVQGQLERFAAFEEFKGVRHIIEGEADDRFILREDFCRGIAQLARFDLTYDVLIRPRHIKYAAEFLAKFPDQPFVVDHLAKPDIKKQKLQPWRQEMQQIAQMDNVYCKLSGMVTEASWRGWTTDDFVPYIEAILDMFGPQRVMFGSDWPVCLVAAGYEQVVQIVESYLATLSDDEQTAVMGRNALDFYHIKA